MPIAKLLRSYTKKNISNTNRLVISVMLCFFFWGKNIYLRWFEFVFKKESYFHQIHINICAHTLFFYYKFEWKNTRWKLRCLQYDTLYVCLVSDFNVYLLCKIAQFFKLSFPVTYNYRSYMNENKIENQNENIINIMI